MTTLVIIHEVDDVEHWRTSTRREEYFGPLGITARTFIDPDKSNRVGLIVECPSLEAFQESLQGEGAADAMKFDGVRPGDHPDVRRGLSRGRHFGPRAIVRPDGNSWSPDSPRPNSTLRPPVRVGTCGPRSITCSAPRGCSPWSTRARLQTKTLAT